MIRDHLVPALKAEFSGWEISFDNPPQPVATFPACQDSVGKVTVYDEDDEVMVDIEKITHGHFHCHDEEITDQNEKEKIIVESVVDFLKALFSDQVLLFTNPDNRVGGWSGLDWKDGPIQLSSSYRYFLWSKPYKP